jgi:hypothetical protein
LLCDAGVSEITELYLNVSINVVSINPVVDAVVRFQPLLCILNVFLILINKGSRTLRLADKNIPRPLSSEENTRKVVNCVAIEAGFRESSI